MRLIRPYGTAAQIQQASQGLTAPCQMEEEAPLPEEPPATGYDKFKAATPGV